MAGCDEAARRVRFLAPLLALTVLLASCASAATSGTEGSDGVGSRAAREFDRPVRWESGLWEDLGRSLTIVFTGGPVGNLERDPCAGEYDVEIDEADESVTITVYSLKLVDPPAGSDTVVCLDVGYGRTLLITIGGSGLGERALIDGARGEVRAPIDRTALLVPGALPEGWSERYQYPQGSAMVRGYGRDEGSGSGELTYLEAPVDDGFHNLNRETLERRELTTLKEIGVRGNDRGAYVITSLEDGARFIVFEEDGRFHQVTIQADIDETVGLAFVESLR